MPKKYKFLSRGSKIGCKEELRNHLFPKQYKFLSRGSKIGYKEELRNHLLPKKYKFLLTGSKIGCKLLTQIRVGRSNLNFHSFTVKKAPSPECACPGLFSIQ